MDQGDPEFLLCVVKKSVQFLWCRNIMLINIKVVQYSLFKVFTNISEPNERILVKPKPKC